jgi:hypothetical protein
VVVALRTVDGSRKEEEDQKFFPPQDLIRDFGGDARRALEYCERMPMLSQQTL